MNLEIRSLWPTIMCITFMDDLTASSQRHVHLIYRKKMLLLVTLSVWWESVLTPSVTTHQPGPSMECLYNRGEIRFDGNFFKVFSYIITYIPTSLCSRNKNQCHSVLTTPTAGQKIPELTHPSGGLRDSVFWEWVHLNLGWFFQLN